MSSSNAHPPFAETINQHTHSFSCSTGLAEPSKGRKSMGSTRPFTPPSDKAPASSPPASPTLCSPRSNVLTKKTRREIFNHHLKSWALNHDSSAYFHGTITLHPQDTCLSEDLELGKSVSCVLAHASDGDPPKNIVIRLFRSRRYYANTYQGEVPEWDIRHGLPIAPYQLVIRSGSGWVPARQYFDRHYFARHARLRREREWASQQPASTNSAPNAQRIGWSRSAFNNASSTNATNPSSMTANPEPHIELSASTNLPPNNGLANLILNNPQIPAWVDLAADNATVVSSNGIAHASILSDQSNQGVSLPAASRHNGCHTTARTTVNISPLFRPFRRLPQELQDEILYQAIGYTRAIDLTQTVRVTPSLSASASPITMSQLFRISKTINEHMVPHMFRSTNFHFGLTGFTKFLWQIGPLNRGNLRHLTFHFSNASLLHCMRWMAPDPVWELFEPPVSTNPPTLIYFWRCQLQDLMKELNLSTLTIDIRDVPLADVPMLVRIINTAMGSVERIRVIDNHARQNDPKKNFAQDLHMRFPDMLHATWRDLSLRYHNDYKYQRWHMKHILALRDVDLCPVLDAWMSKDTSFFDS